MTRSLKSCSIFIALLVSLLHSIKTSSAATPDAIDLSLPQPNKVCINGIVVKRALATVLLTSTKNTDAIEAVSLRPDLWRTLFTDSSFCHVPPNCTDDSTSDECKAAAKCVAYRTKAVQAALAFFTSLNTEITRPHPYYTESSELRNAGSALNQVHLYFADAQDNANRIACTGAPAPKAPEPFDPSKDAILSKIRIRGVSDDLNFDRAQLGFKGTTPATASYSADTSAAHTYTTKVSGAIGYAFDSIPQTLIVPYISTYQSITQVSPKAPVLSPIDNVAGGILMQRYFDIGDVSHVFSVKPQFLDNTTTHAELGSVRAIYTPWMDIPFNLNTFTQLDFLPGSPWGELMFNLRADFGSYTNRGNTPAVVAVNKDFDRAGTQVGFTLSSDGVPNVPSLTLIVSETYLYGFSGFYRNLSQFQTSLTYNFPNSYLGFTASYKNGRDEDTAVFAQIWTVGVSAHY
jgi:hypothetical protein